MLMLMHGKKGLNGDGRRLRWFLVPLLPRPRIVIDDRISDQSGTFIPDLLFLFGFNSELSAVDERDRSPQSMIGFSSIQCFLYTLT